MRSILRTFIAFNRRGQWSRAGFVLPTVTMVMLVVVLLTLAISLRSFDRAQDARNVRVSQAVLSAAAPALDRARAKLEELLVTNPPTTDTPTDDALYGEFTTQIGGDKYTFGDEQRLQVSYNINEEKGIEKYGENNDASTIEDNEITETAWRFPVDTDNNGKYDSFTVYGIFFRTPARNDDGNFQWARTPLDARTPPIPSGTAGESQDCKVRAGSSSSLVGDSGWYKSEGKLQKSFFVYTVTVPITDTDLSAVTKGYDSSKFVFETFTGTTGFSALEYQQDWKRIPLTNNAVVYEDDLDISPGPDFRLNGRIQANSNLIISSTNKNDIELYLVSSSNSCFYQDEENSKIIVGGNVINGLLTSNNSAETIEVNLQQGNSVNDGKINKSHQSVSSYTASAPITNAAQASAYNSEAYANRINWLVDEHIDNSSAPDPVDGTVAEDPLEVRKKVDESTNKEQARKNALETYFKKLVRKVPFAEVSEGGTDPTVSLGTDGKPTNTLIEGTGDELRPTIASWVLPTNGDLETGEAGGPTNLTLAVAELEATNPAIVEENDNNQYFVGDRFLVGNNLPQRVWDDDANAFTSSFQQLVDGTTTWQNESGGDSGVLRYREPRVAAIADVGSTDRDGFWEDAAATAPEAALDGIGGLRVITGAGVYERENSFLPPPPANSDGFTVVWPDTMPMSPADYSRVYDNVAGEWKADALAPNLPILYKDLSDTDKTTATPTIDASTPKYAKGDLRMRATAIYHYAVDSINDTDDFLQAPIACISSYYDPSTSVTGRNESSLADVSGLDEPTYTSATGSNAGNSNNGIVYGPPPTRPGAGAYDSSTQRFTNTSGLLGMLAAQANMVFPDGRFVNEKLRDALQKADADRSLSEQAAMDTTMCALGILGNSEVALGSKPSYIPNGAIKEIAFLDGRQIKASDPDNPSTTSVDETFTRDGADFTSDYNLSLEERQPMEIRATQIDLNVLRTAGFTPTTSVGPRRDNNEYLLPLSGIIYASRDDALPDRSDPDSTSNDDLANSAYDYKLDPTRRPNAIMLVNGETVARTPPDTMTSEEVMKEKGLTLVSNLPVYIQGDFNLHKNSSDDLIEEFNNELDDNWGDFYTRSGFDGNFACRAGDPRLSACTQGDNWRPVNILADTLTLLSADWRPGFRNEGDFDLRNNVGNGAVMATQSAATELTAQDLRRHNGFYANNYVTNGLSSGANFDGATYADTNYSGNATTPLKSSYFNNFVTPVQRRVEFNEYVMEVCLKWPVSACEADDWVVGEVDAGGNIAGSTRTVYDLFDSQFNDGALSAGADFATNIEAKIGGSSINSSSLASGTTAAPSHQDWQRFPRRVAFLRNKYGELEMTGEKTPIPIGVDGSGNVKAYFYGGGEVPRLANNALWLKTTNSTSEANTRPSYDKDKLLYYLGYNQNKPDSSGNSPFLPPMPTIDIDGTEYSFDIGTAGDELYRYGVCLSTTNFGRRSKEYFMLQNDADSSSASDDNIYVEPAKGKVAKGCPYGQTINDNFFGGNGGSGLHLATESTPQSLTDAATIDVSASDDLNGDGVVIMGLPTTIGDSTDVTLTLTGDANTIFVLNTDGDVTFGSNDVTMVLNGVDPNNVFWVVKGNVKFGSGWHQVVGNFIGYMDTASQNEFSIDVNTYLRGVRILGFFKFTNGSGSGINSKSAVPNNVDVRGMTNQGNVSLVPVLQIHEPDATTAAKVDGGLESRNNTNWLVNPEKSTTYNLVAAVSDTPSRPGEGNGGLQNLVGFLENWKPQKVNISGSFIQLGRSKYATAPFTQVKREAIGDDSELFGYEQYYHVGDHAGARGFQTPPERPWGFDVGLLSQSPDLFAQKFTLPSSDNKPNEYFREVSRDDDWIKGLLCAKLEDDGTTHAVSRPSGLVCTDYE